MVRIKITDLPQDTKISREEMKKVFGGAGKSLTQSYANPLETAAFFIPGDRSSLTDLQQLSSIEEDPWHAMPSSLRR